MYCREDSRDLVCPLHNPSCHNIQDASLPSRTEAADEMVFFSFLYTVHCSTGMLMCVPSSQSKYSTHMMWYHVNMFVSTSACLYTECRHFTLSCVLHVSVAVSVDIVSWVLAQCSG